MNDTNTMLVDAAGRLFADICTREARDAADRGPWPQVLWEAAEGLGLTRALDEEEGGSPLGLDTLAVIARTAGAHAVPLPLVEGFVAQRLLAVAGLASPPGRASVGAGCGPSLLRLRREGDRLLASGRLRRVPWGRDTDYVVALGREEGGGALFVLRLHGLVPSRCAANLAGEPRDDFTLHDHPLPADAVSPLPGGADPETALFEGALMRCLQMTGALQKVLQQTVAYSTERVQFGRPIAGFQAIQQQIAELATHVAAAVAAADAALLAACAGSARFQIAAAKARCSEAAGAAAAIAHQVHGAMGFTHEHSLHWRTRRLLSWRDEFGSETEWSGWNGRLLRAIGTDGGDREALWALVTRPSAFAAQQRATEVWLGAA